MSKFIVLYSSSGYDGDDAYMFGETDIHAIEETREQAEKKALALVEDLKNEYIPPAFYEEVGVPNAWNEAVENLLTVETEENALGEIVVWRIEHNDEMFPHLGIVKIIMVQC